MKRPKFFLVLSNLFLLVVLIGFSRTLYLKSFFESPDLPVHLVLHGIVLTAWFLLATVQPILVATNNTGVHRKLGTLGIIVAVLVVVLGILTLVIRDAPTIDEFPNRAGGNIYSLFAFLICLILGLKFRKKPMIHKRLMLLASMPLLAPALDRMARIPVLNNFFGKILFWFPAPPEVAFAILSFFGLILSVVVYDLIAEKKIHRGTVWGLVGIFIFAPAVTATITLTGAWASFVRFVM